MTEHKTMDRDRVRESGVVAENKNKQTKICEHVPLYRFPVFRTQSEDISDDKNEPQNSSLTLLSVLDDKNKAIAALKEQLDNQKMQLVYYIRKALSSSKLFKLAETCEPGTAEDSIQLALALNNFYKQSGMKTRLKSLYERMCDVDERIRVIVQRQEAALGEILDHLFVSSQNAPNILEFDKCLCRFFTDSQQFELFDRIFQSTIGLKKELNRFRLCCNRLIVIEDERNSLVEQVYMMPAQQRIQCNYMAAIQMEKRRLEKEMKEIRSEQKELNGKLNQLNVVEKGAHGSEGNDSSENSSEASWGTHLGEVLEAVKTDAMSLLTMAEDQRGRYNSVLEAMTEENTKLKGQLTVMQRAMKEKDRLAAKVEHLEVLFNTLIKEVEEQRKVEINREREMGELRLRLRLVRGDKDKLEEQVLDLTEELQEVEILRLKLEDMETLKMERDNYKSQVEDLEAIRTAYSQLVEHYPRSSSALVEQERKIEDLENERDWLRNEVTKMKENSSLQETQIEHLLMIIEKFAESDKTHNEVPIKTNTATQYDENHVEDCDVTTHTSTTLSSSSFQRRQVPAPPSNSLRRSSLNSWSRKCNSSGLPTTLVGDSGFATSTNERDISTEGSVQFSDGIGTRRSVRSQKLPVFSSTCVEIHSTDKRGKKETMKAVLESSSSLQGTIQMDGMRNLSLVLNYKKQQQSPLESIEDSQENKSQQEELDDFELMKDCSIETVPSYTRYHKEEHFKSSSIEEKINVTEVSRKETYECRAPKTLEIKSCRHYSEESISSTETESLYTSSTMLQAEKMGSRTNQLKEVTSGMSKTLAQPEGKASIIKSLKAIYGSSLGRLLYANK